jgi:hypothetical protein
MLIDPTQSAQNAKAMRRLIKKWLMAQGTKEKAQVIISRNPHIGRPARSRKSPGA